MCTLLVAFQVYEGTPLVIGANRDEFLARPSVGFRRWTDEARDILAPVDLRAGGTWLGLNDAGVLAAITNRFGTPPDSSRRSRGELVPRALAGASAMEAINIIEALEPQSYNPFHLLLADAQRGEVLWSDGGKFHRMSLSPGYTVLTERSFGASSTSREHGLRQILEQRPSEAELFALLAQHASEAEAGSCIHLDTFAYGTRSSTRVHLQGDGEWRIEHAEGPPCSTDYQPVEWSTVPLRTVTTLG